MMCWCQKNVIFRWGQKQDKNSHFEPLFRDPQKRLFLTIFRVLTSFDDFMMCWQQILTLDDVNDALMMTLMTKKSCSRDQKWRKMTLSKTWKKNAKRSPVRAARNRGAEESQGAFMTRSREQNLPDIHNKKNDSNKTREWHVECERSDVRGVLRNMRSILTWVIYPTRGTHESRRVRAQRSACRYRKKSVRIFLIRSFMTARRLGNRHTRP
jgi:hypothetical protein